MNSSVKIIRFSTIDSTHAYAHRLLDSNLIGKYVQSSDNNSYCIIVAEEQTEGVGRGKRSWISKKGNLFASMIMWLPKNKDLSELSLTAGCAVRDTIVHILPNNVSNDVNLHWPNDVYYRDKKISGILMATSGDYLIVSVGININSSPNCVSNKQSISVREILKEENKLIHIKQTLDILQEKLKQWFLDLNNVGFSCIRSYWLQNVCEINCSVTIRNGLDSITGLFVDIDDCGKLVLEIEGKRKLISNGDLFKNQEGIIVQDE